MPEFDFQDDDNVALLIKGIAYRATDEEVAEFFQEYKTKEDSLQWGIAEDGRRNGFACICFENEDEAERAKGALDRGYIGARWVFLNRMTYGKYKTFMEDPIDTGRSSSGGGGGSGNTVKLSDVVADKPLEKCLALRGLPFRVKVDEIQEFFSEICTVPEDKITIEEENGRRSGAGLVELESEDQAQEVKDALQRKEIGGRFIQLFDQNDGMWEKLCAA